MTSSLLNDVLADVDAECRRREIPMLGPHKAQRLAGWIRQANPQVVVEVGTAIGYSGLWIADVLRDLGKGRLITLERDFERAEQARANFARAGLTDHITMMVGDARENVGQIDGPIDVLFLDGGFVNYYPCFVGVFPISWRVPLPAPSVQPVFARPHLLRSAPIP